VVLAVVVGVVDLLGHGWHNYLERHNPPDDNA
jgi:hypothetical protein